MNNGVLNIYKPKGLTSHDVVNKVRRIAGMKKVGHTGTLDPMAEGVLPICLGKATRIAEYLTADTKQYLAEMSFGQQTDTLDAEGEVTAECALPEADADQILQILHSFTGKQKQIPPLYSAIKKDGKPLYKYARSGMDVIIPEREITVFDIQLVQYNVKTLSFVVTCSKGTYIRSLARDIAIKAGSCGHLTYLQRTKSGHFDSKQSVTIDQLALHGVQKFLISIGKALPEFKKVVVSNEHLAKVTLGNAVFLPEQILSEEELVAVESLAGEVVAIARLSDGHLQPKKVFV